MKLKIIKYSNLTQNYGNIAATLVASGTAVGTGTTSVVSITSGATLGVGQVANTTLASIGTGQILSVASLTVTSTANTALPALTFNRFGNETSDTLNLTSAGAALPKSTANNFVLFLQS